MDQKRSKKRCNCKHHDHHKKCINEHCIDLEQCLISSTLDERGNRQYVLKVTVKNKCNRCIKKFFVRNSLLTSLDGGSLLEVKIVPNKGKIIPVTDKTPQEILDDGNIIDFRVSTLKACSTVCIIYCLKYLDNTTPIFDLFSCVSVGGKKAHTEFNELKLIPQCCSSNTSLVNFNGPCTNTTGKPAPGCVRFDGDELGKDGTKCTTIGTQEICVTVNNWIPMPNGSGYIGFDYQVTGGIANCGVVKYGRNTINFITEPATSGSFDETSINKRISNVNFCLDCFPFTVNITGPNIICLGESGMFTAIVNIPNTFTYSWFLDGILDPGQTGNMFTTPSNLPVGTHTLKVNVTDNCGNINSDTVEFEIIPLPVLFGIGGASNALVGETRPYIAGVATAVPPFVINWEIIAGDATVVPVTLLGANVTFNAAGLVVIQATVTDATGCTSLPITKEVTVV